MGNLTFEEYKKWMGIASEDTGTRKLQEKYLRKKKGYKNLKKHSKNEVYRICHKVIHSEGLTS